MVTLAVVGVRDVWGREFDDSRFVASELSRYREWIEEVISGGARGTDRMAIRWAKRQGLRTRELLPDIARYGSPLAMFVRNHQIGDACDLMVAFWDGRSSGTRDAIDYCERLGKPVEVIQI